MKNARLATLAVTLCAAALAASAAPSCLVDVPPAEEPAGAGSSSGQGGSGGGGASGNTGGAGGQGQGGALNQGGGGGQIGAGGQGGGGQGGGGQGGGPGGVTRCEDLGYNGACLGSLSMWEHTDGLCHIRDCAAEGVTCELLGNNEGWGCALGDGSTNQPCSAVNALGACFAGTLVWREGELCRGQHCPSSGKSCVPASGSTPGRCQ